MTINQATVFPLTIPINTATSNSLPFSTILYDAEGLYVQAPATLDAGTYTWEASQDGGTTWATLKDTSNTAIAVPAQASGICYNGVFGGIILLRIKSSVNVTAEKIFLVQKIWRGI